jgi:type IV pilus assembly protein PilN
MAVKINLLDWRTELNTLRKNQFFALLGVGAAVAIIGVAVVYFGVTGAIEYQQERNRFLTTQIAEMDKKIKEIEELEKVKANLLARMKVIEELQASRAAMVHFFDEILDTLPDGVYIKSLKQAGASVTIEGVAESNNRVSAYMKNIDASSWFAEPKLVIINTKDVNRRRQSEFRMQFKNLTRQKAPAAGAADASEESPE